MFEDPRTAAGVGSASGRGSSAAETPSAEPTVRDASPTGQLPDLEHPEPDQLDLAAVLHALSDPVRLRIVAELSGGEERSCKSFDLPVVKSTCTHHFRVLREAGVIRQRVVGATRLNSLRRGDLEARFPGLLESVLRVLSAPVRPS